MAVFIRGQVVINSSLTNNGGFFMGQNIQSGWDSSSSMKTAGGLSMGDGVITTGNFARYYGRSTNHQGTYDDDFKSNQNRSHSV